MAYTVRQKQGLRRDARGRGVLRYKNMYYGMRINNGIDKRAQSDYAANAYNKDDVDARSIIVRTGYIWKISLYINQRSFY